jgi:hypothetical protein
MYNGRVWRQLYLFANGGSIKYSGPGLTNMNTVWQDGQHSAEIR